MPYSFNIKNINGDFDNLDDERYIDPREDDDYSNYDDEPYSSKRIIENDCFACSGTGEGHSPDSSCSWCHGTGILKRKV